MTSSHIHASAAIGTGTSERPDAISVNDFRALSPSERATRLSAIDEYSRQRTDEAPNALDSIPTPPARLHRNNTTVLLDAEIREGL